MIDGLIVSDEANEDPVTPEGTRAQGASDDEDAASPFRPRERFAATPVTPARPAPSPPGSGAGSAHRGAPSSPAPASTVERPRDRGAGGGREP